MRVVVGFPWTVRLLGGLAILWGVLALPDLAPGQLPARLSDTAIAVQVLNRLAFGPRPGQVARVTGGWQRWVKEQLDPKEIADDAAEALTKKRCPSLRLSLTDLQAVREDDKRGARVKDELREAILLRAVYSKRQMQEVVVEFWRNHLNVDVNKVPFLATHYEENVLRKHAFGKFEDLLLASAKHPAMLVYLDNYVSNKDGLNENYARELMELHTLGVDNFYTQQDVIALARVLTGWTCGMRDGEYQFYFKALAHDTTPGKVVGLRLDGDGGVADGEKAIRHLANHEGTARFLSTKLCRYFVSDEPSPVLIDKVAGVFRKTGGDLREVYRAIILSPDFTSPKNYRVKFKTPFEYTVSALRATTAEISDAQQLFRELRLMGQPIYECEDPTGYSDQREAWLDPGIMVYRWNFAIALVTGKVKGVHLSPSFANEVARMPAEARPRKVMQMLQPGVHDPKVLALSFQTLDARAMIAWALGSASFQQQ